MHFYLETAKGARKNPDFHPQQQSGYATPGISMKYGKKLFLGDFHESGFPEILKKAGSRYVFNRLSRIFPAVTSPRFTSRQPISLLWERRRKRIGTTLPMPMGLTKNFKPASK